MSWHYGGGYGFRPYVNVAQRRKNAERETAKRAKKGHHCRPIHIEGLKIARTFWGKAWCDHLEEFCDFENRLPRGRTYVRNGSVIDLCIETGEVTALVMGSELYKVKIKIAPLASDVWAELKTACAGQIGSVIELLQGKLSDSVMQVVAQPQRGLFPLPGQIKLDCSCPDWADMCKHVAATLYGVGARLDHEPELLFKLRGVDEAELISQAGDITKLDKGGSGKRRTLSADALSDVFGIELETPPAPLAPGEVTAASSAGSKSEAQAKRSRRAGKRAGVERPGRSVKLGKPTARKRAARPKLAG
jgi:uncharacterized Zn finger protein